MFKGYADGMASALVGKEFKVVSTKSGEGNRYVKVKAGDEEFWFLPSELDEV